MLHCLGKCDFLGDINIPSRTGSSYIVNMCVVILGPQTINAHGIKIDLVRRTKGEGVKKSKKLSTWFMDDPYLRRSVAESFAIFAFLWLKHNCSIQYQDLYGKKLNLNFKIFTNLVEAIQAFQNN